MASRIIAVTGGKGGVGKTVNSIHLAYSAKVLGKRTLLVDLDLGLPNLDIVLNVESRYNIKDTIDGHMNLADVVVHTNYGFDLLASSSGCRDLANLSALQRMQLVEIINESRKNYEVIVLDMGAGIHRNIMDFVAMADAAVIVTNPEPHAMADAYAVVKLLSLQTMKSFIGISVNQAESEAEGTRVFDRLRSVSDTFLKRSVEYVGSSPFDVLFQKHIARRTLLSPEAIRCVAAHKLILNFSQMLKLVMPQHRGSSVLRPVVDAVLR